MSSCRATGIIGHYGLLFIDGGLALATDRSRPVPAKLRASILERDSHACARCGRPVDVSSGYYSLHHRLPRSRGGTHTPENLVTLCGSGTTRCHVEVESLRAQARAEGWLVPTGVDPAAWPVLRGGQWWQLTAEGWVPSVPHPLQTDIPNAG